VKFIFCP